MIIFVMPVCNVLRRKYPVASAFFGVRARPPKRVSMNGLSMTAGTA
jgi:hypothetical protein